MRSEQLAEESDDPRHRGGSSPHNHRPDQVADVDPHNLIKQEGLTEPGANHQVIERSANSKAGRTQADGKKLKSQRKRTDSSRLAEGIHGCAGSEPARQPNRNYQGSAVYRQPPIPGPAQ